MSKNVTDMMEFSFYLFLLQKEDTQLLFSAMLYECVTKECPEMLPTYIAIEQVK